MRLLLITSLLCLIVTSFSLATEQERVVKCPQLLSLLGDDYVSPISAPLNYFFTRNFQQPKKMQGLHAQELGYASPQVFNNLIEAIASGKPFIIRSESPDDLDGPSGIGRSFVITNEDLVAIQQKIANEEYLPVMPMQTPNIVLQQLGLPYLPQSLINSLVATRAALQIDEESFSESLNSIYAHELEIYSAVNDHDILDKFQQVTYSYQEYVEGWNVAIAADDVVFDRYHFYVTNPSLHFAGYFTLDEDKMIHSWFSERSSILDSLDLQNIVTFYNSLRNEAYFKSERTGVMELAVDNAGEINFLQYMYLGKEHSEPKEISRSPKPDEQVSHIVRGATLDSNGNLTSKEILLTLSAPGFRRSEAQYRKELGSGIFPTSVSTTDFDFPNANGAVYLQQRGIFGPSYIEGQARNFEALLFAGGEDYGQNDVQSAFDHLTRSAWLKPKVSFILPLESLLSRDQYKSLLESDRPKSTALRIRLLSDGKKAYVKLIEVLD